MKVLLILFLFATNVLISKKPTVEYLTVAKSGTHIVKKCVSLIEEKTGGKNFKNKNKHYHFHGRHFSSFHKLDSKVKDFSKKYIVNIRDPRDVAISSVHWMDREKGKSHLFKQGKISKSNWDLITFDQKLLKVIKNALDSQYKWFYRLYQKNYSNILLVRFENLVGSQGGGSDLLQKEEIVKIARFLGEDFTEDQVDEIANNLFGGTHTFRKGLIGGHKKHFTCQHYEAFEETFADLLEPLSMWYDFSRD